MAKYKTYKDLARAFKSGKLQSGKDARGHRTGYYVMLDKGGTQNCLNFFDPALSEAENERRQEGCSLLFEPPEGIEPLFAALEIPCEWC